MSIAHTLGCLDKQFALPELVLAPIHFDAGQNPFNTSTLVAFPPRPAFLGKYRVPVKKLGEGSPVGKPGSAHADVFLQPEIFDLEQRVEISTGLDGFSFDYVPGA